MLSVLLGQADSYVLSSYGLETYDSCAFEALLKSHGGEVSDVSKISINFDLDIWDAIELQKAWRYITKRLNIY